MILLSRCRTITAVFIICTVCLLHGGGLPSPSDTAAANHNPRNLALDAAAKQPAETEKQQPENASPTLPDSSVPLSQAEPQKSEPAENGQNTVHQAPDDHTFASIRTGGMTIAEEARWYYEKFDKNGRPVLAVLYENNKELEKTLWQYHGASAHPKEKMHTASGEAELIRYDTEGRILSIEQYTAGNQLLSKTENRYDTNGRLIEQTVIDRTGEKEVSIWEFKDAKAVSQTKYRQGKKTAFIELYEDKHIVHIYADDQELLVTTEEL